MSAFLYLSSPLGPAFCQSIPQYIKNNRNTVLQQLPYHTTFDEDRILIHQDNIHIRYLYFQTT